MSRLLVAGIAISALSFSVVISAQQEQPQQPTAPLGDLARQAEAAKANAKKAKKTYTNANLSADPRGETPSPAPAPESGFVSKSLGKVVPAEEMVKRSEEQVEKEAPHKEREEIWRMRSESLRKEIDVVQRRIAALSSPSGDTLASPTMKKSNDADLANARMALDGLKKRWSQLEAAAVTAKVPAGWLDPRPSLQ